VSVVVGPTSGGMVGNGASCDDVGSAVSSDDVVVSSDALF